MTAASASPVATGLAAPRAATRAFNTAAHGLRGIAAMMVFVAHLLGGTAEHIYAADAGYVAGIRPFWNIGTFGVELFFVISGFVILPSVTRYSAGGFALRRFLRLYPLFLVFSLLFIVLNALTNDYPRLNTPLAVVSGLTFTNLFTGTEQLTPNAWSLSFEVMFYLGTALVWHTLVRQRSWLAGIPALAAVLAFWIAFPITTYFILGLGVRLLHDRGHLLSTGIARACEVAAVAAMLGFASIAHHEYGWADVTAPEVVPLMLATAAYFYFAIHPDSLSARLFSGRAVLWLGTVSYSLYIVHPYIYLPMRMAFARAGWFTPDTLGSMLLFGAAVTPPMLLATAAVHVTLERWPYRRFFRQNIYRAPD